MKVTINTKIITDAALAAQVVTAQAINSRSLDVIRRPGAFPEYPPSDRDIVDTGNLRDNQRPPVRVSPDKVIIGNDAEYAVFVYLGYLTTTGRGVPARMWMHLAAQEINIQATFADAMRFALK